MSAFLRVLAIAALAALAGCNRPPTSGAGVGASTSDPPIPPPAVLPQCSFADDCGHRQYPEVAAFVTQFLQVCLAGDYEEYRRLVSRYENPESRDRFQAIYHGLRAIVVKRIEPAPKLPRVPDGAFVVVSEVDFDPNAKVALRRASRTVAILAFPEDGQWRMKPAPTELQPREPEPASQPTTDSAPASGPSFPWESDGDH